MASGMSLTIGVLLMALAVAYSQDDNIKLEMSPAGPIKQGDTVVLTCSIKKNLKSFIDVVKFQRKIGDKEFYISSNFEVVSPFKETTRYAADFKEAGEFVVTTLTITDIQGADSGNIGCVLQNEHDLKKFMVIVVNVPVKSVAISTPNSPSVEEGKTADVKAGDKVTCMIDVEGNYIAPTIKTTLGGADVTATPSDPVITNEPNEGLQKLAYKGSVHYAATKEDTGKTFVCEAGYADHPPASSASAVLNVLFKPVFECEKSLLAKVGSKDIQITCKATGNPKPTGGVWTFGPAGSQTTVKIGETNAEGYIAANKDLDSGVEFTFTIPDVKKDHIQKYTLTASNAAGDSSTDIELREEVVVTATTPKPTVKPTYRIVTDKPKPTEEPKQGESKTGSASGLVSTLFTTIICFLTLETLLTSM